jgi:hypothetical protein
MNAQYQDTPELPVETSEIELSTDELVELSDAPGSDQSSAPAITPRVESRAEATIESNQSSAHLQSKRSTESRPSRSASRYLVIAACVVSACIGAGALYSYAKSPTSGQISAPIARVTWPTPTEQTIDAKSSDTAAAVETQSPVRFANPFDKGEIFEFPPGTSKAEARDAVAKILRDRANERLPQLESRNHRARKSPTEPADRTAAVTAQAD